MTDAALIISAALAGIVSGVAGERLVRRYPREGGTPPSRRRAGVLGAVAAVVFAALAWRIGSTWELAPALLLGGVALAAAAVDLEHRIIPNGLNLAGGLGVYASAVLAQPDRALELLVGGAAAFVVFLVLWLVSPRGFGLGDVKMAPMLGFALGRHVVTAILAATVIGALAALAVMALGGAAARRRTLPYGPFLAAGAIVGLLLAGA